MNKTQAAAVEVGDRLVARHYPARHMEVISIHQNGDRTSRTWGDGVKVFPVFGVLVANKDGHYLEEVSYTDVRAPYRAYECDGCQAAAEEDYRLSNPDREDQ